MKPIQKQRIDEQVYESLLSNLRDNTWRPGEKLPSEAQLCEIFHVSRVTVRSAIQRLKAVGLVEIKHGKGTYVIDPNKFNAVQIFSPELNLTEKEFYDITELRETLEPKAAELFIRQGTREDMENFTEVFHKLSSAKFKRSYEEYTQIDFQFHYTIILSTHNDLFIQIANVVKEPYFRYFRELNKFLLTDKNDQDLADFSVITDNHGELYEAIINREVDRAVAITEKILTSNKESFVQYLQDREAQATEAG